MIDKPNEQVKILIVDDSPVNIDFMLELLKDYDIRTVISGQQALEAVQKELPDLILLDITMPGLNGFETCQQLKASPKTKNIPVIFLSASQDTDSIVKGFKVGGVDYITKPYNTEEVRARIQTHVKLKFALEELALMNDYDAFSGALKRDAFLNNSIGWLRRANKLSMPLYLFIIRIDNAQIINDKYGHTIGDTVIKAVVVVAKKVLKIDYIITRFFGGEFIVLFKDTTKEEAMQQAKQFQNAISGLRLKKVPDLNIAISIGMAASSAEDSQIEDTITRATKNILKD